MRLLGRIRCPVQSPRQAIRDAAVAVYLRSGDVHSSVEEIAAVAGVSKQTVYNQFSDKETLFIEAIQATVGPIQESFAQLISSPAVSDDTAGDGFKAEVRAIARRLIRSVARPDVIRLRRIVIAEADRYPDLARDWYEQGPAQSVRTLAAIFSTYAERGLIVADDLMIAAEQFNWLVLGHVLNTLMFTLPDNPFTEADLDRIADAGARVSLGTYAAARPASEGPAVRKDGGR